MRTWFRNANHWYPITSWLGGLNPKRVRSLWSEPLTNRGEEPPCYIFYLRFWWKTFCIRFRWFGAKKYFDWKFIFPSETFIHTLKIFWNAFWSSCEQNSIIWSFMVTFWPIFWEFWPQSPPYLRKRIANIRNFLFHSFQNIALLYGPKTKFSHFRRGRLGLYVVNLEKPAYMHL